MLCQQDLVLILAPSTCYQTFGRLFNFFQNFHFVKHKLIEKSALRVFVNIHSFICKQVFLWARHRQTIW